MLEGDKEVSPLSEEYLNAEKRLRAELAACGVSILPKPILSTIDGVAITEDGEPVLPPDITNQGLKQIGQLYSICNSYFSYLIAQVTLADMEQKIWEETKDLIWSRVRQEKEGKRDDKDDYARNNPRYIRINSEYMIKYHKYSILKSKKDQFENNLKVLSREIARRELELKFGIRDNNTQGKRFSDINDKFNG